MSTFSIKRVRSVRPWRSLELKGGGGGVGASASELHSVNIRVFVVKFTDEAYNCVFYCFILRVLRLVTPLY